MLSPQETRWGLRMVFLDNILRPLEPVMILACASLYAGGAWGSFRMGEAMVYLLYKLCLMGLDRGVIWDFGQVEFKEHRLEVLASVRAVGLASLVGVAAMVVLSLLTSQSVKGLELGTADLLSQAASIPLLALSELMYQANINRRAMIARIVGTDILIPFLVFGGGWLGHSMGWPITLSRWFLIGNLANAMLAFVSFSRLYAVKWREWIGPVLPSRPLMRYSLPFLWSELLNGLVMRLDLMLVGEFAGIRAVEIYNVIIMLSRTLQGIRQSFEGLLLSAFSRTGNRNFTQAMRTSLNKATWTVMNLLGLALFLISVWGLTFLRLLHPQYMAGYWALVSISAFVFLNAYGDLSAVMLQGLGRSSEYTVAQVVGFAVNLSMNLLLVPKYGIFGGVLALGAAFLLQGSICQTFLWRGSRLLPWKWPQLRSILLMNLILVAFGGWCALLSSRTERVIVSVLAVVVWGAFYMRRIRSQRHQPSLPDLESLAMPELQR
jgi:O-antigen/teichoic acid export membrane protein